MRALCRPIAFLLLFTLLAFATVRTGGLDFDAYLAEFQDPINNLSSHEVGYVALIKVIGAFAGFWLVLLIGNVVFFVCHRPILDRIVTPVQSFAFTFYIAYVGLFLIYGSPRRLIAYSLVAYIIQQIVFDLAMVKRRPALHFALAAVAAAFHASALIFLPVLLAYAFGRTLFNSSAKLAAIAFAVVLLGFALYATGVVEYLVVKVTYYVFYAAGEQEYLEDVPSVTSGLAKRTVAFALIWYGTRQCRHLRRPLFDFCFLEALIYASLGSLSPVLGVTSSYFALSYVLPSLFIRNRQEILSRRSAVFLCAAAIYFIPTSVGLWRQFGDLYVS